MRGTWEWVRRELEKDGAHLVPLRLFMATGWLRAATEKVTEPGWYDGSALTAFLRGQLDEGLVTLPFYRELATGVLLPDAQLLGLVVMTGELLVGLALLLGLLTNAALLGGLFMNLNFILAGVPNPGAFYVLIQVALLVSGVGAVLGLDSFVSRRIHSPLLVAQSGAISRHFRVRRRAWATLVVVCVAGAGYCAAHISTLDPARSVEDPAVILVVLLSFTGMQVLIAAARQRPPEPGRRETAGALQAP